MDNLDRILLTSEQIHRKLREIKRILERRRDEKKRSY